ncbi:hypothetical protein FVR03_09395 [Pontibacter qinzhouensis]|uniref:Toxin n=1 Tax=Pontibacter qinzhouensis TaxID=2603253 RepID=A0A5C8K7N0_9BACT|nr:hypothetical protein [Pontibacter qinzhouensis]TXK47405.1 hypothetical protein FVR03_09395 [Pontibacter qinzhouensis]
MPTLKEVEAFLEALHLKLAFQEVHFIYRPEYISAYAELYTWGYPPNELTKIIKELTPENYSEGPIEDTQNIPSKGQLWIFGKKIGPKYKTNSKKKVEYYIKVQIGYENDKIICISFHPSKFAMKYPNLV